MSDFLKNVKLDDSEQLWLAELYEFYKKREFISTLSLRRKLFSKLDKSFDPQSIDNILVKYGYQLTPLGILYVDPDSKILERIDHFLRGLKKHLLNNFKKDKFLVEDILNALELSKDEFSIILDLIKQTASQPFQSIFEVADLDQKGQGIDFHSSEVIEEIINYESIEKFVEEKILYPNNQSQQKEATNLTAIQHPGRIRKNVVFIIMAMDPNKPELDDILNTIKEVCTVFDLKAFRADEIEHQERITDIVLQQIKECEFVIADLSFERPNVYYEIGYAHAIEKRPILYRKQGTPLHFDLSIHNVPEYKNITDLKKQLTKRFEAILGRVVNEK